MSLLFVSDPSGGASRKHMAQDRKIRIGVGIVGFPLAVLGMIFLIGGNVAVGLPFLAAGMGLVVIGLAASRKGG